MRPGPPGKLLDVGCAHGFMLDEARAAGWDGQGVEIANVAAQHARDRFGFVVHPDLDAAAASGERFDVVTFLQVVAHLPSGADALEAAHDVLRPDGMLVIETANRGSRIARVLGRHWHFIAPPSVLSLFDAETLDGLLRRTGFERVASFPTRKAVSLSLTANVMEQRYGRLFAPVRALTGTPALRHRAVRYPFADLMTIIATRV